MSYIVTLVVIVVASTARYLVNGVCGQISRVCFLELMGFPKVPNILGMLIGLPAAYDPDVG